MSREITDLVAVNEDSTLKASSRSARRIPIYDIPIVKAELERADEVLGLRNLEPAVSLFGSARLTKDDRSYQLAFEIAKALSERGVSIITGGGPGVMEAGNRGCQAGKLGTSIGLNIKLPREQSPNIYQDLSLHFDHFLTRKTVFLAYSEAFICVPGGFGTLDELMEALTLMQTKKMIEKPIILVDRQFWQPLLDWFGNELLSQEMIIAKDLDRVTLVDSVEEVLAALAPIYKELSSEEAN